MQCRKQCIYIYICILLFSALNKFNAGSFAYLFKNSCFLPKKRHFYVVNRLFIRFGYIGGPSESWDFPTIMTIWLGMIWGSPVENRQMGSNWCVMEEGSLTHLLVLEGGNAVLCRRTVPMNTHQHLMDLTCCHIGTQSVRSHSHMTSSFRCFW